MSKFTEVIGRVLGPADREISCETCFEELDRYVELELSGGRAHAVMPGFRAHLSGCPACREDYESLKAFVGGEQL